MKTESESTDLMASLASRSLFIGLTDAQLGLLVKAGSIEHFEPGQVIALEGQPGQALYIILSGSVSVAPVASQPGRHPESIVLRSERTPDALYGVDFFGEMSVLDFESISATVTALEPCDLLVVPVAGLYKAFQQDRDIHIIVISNLARTLSYRLRLANERHDTPGPCHCRGPEACGSQLT
ncbi:MAG: cyclic nucleotide-binding domain-containing protein [Phycisphaerales bacterium]|nr:MAG: cyclic nucleotide-binding domain-containing protein [Phycisphaerales bacterium]